RYRNWVLDYGLPAHQRKDNARLDQPVLEPHRDTLQDTSRHQKALNLGGSLIGRRARLFHSLRQTVGENPGSRHCAWPSAPRWAVNARLGERSLSFARMPSSPLSEPLRPPAPWRAFREFVSVAQCPHSAPTIPPDAWRFYPHALLTLSLVCRSPEAASGDLLQ